MDGIISSVTTRDLGAQITEPASVGATILALEHVADFADEGGQLQLPRPDETLATLTYTGCDRDLCTITLANPLTFAVDDEGFAAVYPPATEQVAMVIVDEEDAPGDGDMIEAVVPYVMRAMLADGIRDDPDTAEQVVVDVVAGDYAIADLRWQQPMIGLDTLPPSARPSTPAPVTDLDITASLYMDGRGVSHVAITAVCAPVTSDVNDDPCVPTGYELWGQSPGELYRRIAVSESEVINYKPLVAGSTWTFKARALGSGPGGFSPEVYVVLPVDTTPPPTPKAGTATAYLGGLTVDQLCLSEDNGPMPADLARIELEMQIGAGPWMVRHTFPAGRGAVSLTGLTYGALHNFRLRAFDFTGNMSGYSAVFSATPTRVVGSDLDVVLPGEVAFSDVGNLIPDGSFESAAVRDLRSWAPSGNGVWAFVSGAARHGDWSLRCTVGSDADQYLYLCGSDPGSFQSEFLPTTPKIYVSAWVRAAAGTNGAASVGARFIPQGGGPAIYADSAPVAPATGWQQIQAVFPVPAGTRSVNVRLRIAGGNAGSYWWDSVVVKDVIPSMMLEDLAVTNAKVSDLAANKITTGEIAVGQVVSVGPVAGTHSELTSTGLRGYSVGRTTPVVGITTGSDDLIAIYEDAPPGEDGTPPTLAALDALGRLQAVGVSVAEPDIDVDGNRVGGLEIYGVEFRDWLTSYGRGVLARGVRKTSTVAISDPGSDANAQGFLEIQWPALERDRNYQLIVSSHAFQLGAAGRFRGQVTVAYDGTPVTPGSTPLDINNSYAATSGSAYFTLPIIRTFATNGQSSQYREARFLYSFRGLSTSAAILADGGGCEMTLIDLGPYLPDVGIDWEIGGGAPPTSQNKTYTSVWNCSGGATYQGSSRRTDIGTDVRQGRSDDQWGIALFNHPAGSGETSRTIASAMSGATLQKAEVYLYATHWYWNAGGTAIIRARTGTSAGSSESAVGGSSKSSGGWPKPGGRWVDITSIWSTSSRSIQVGKVPDKSDYKYYGWFAGNTNDSHQPKLRLTYQR